MKPSQTAQLAAAQGVGFVNSTRAITSSEHGQGENTTDKVCVLEGEKECPQE
jgi:hypothetical protein